MTAGQPNEELSRADFGRQNPGEPDFWESRYQTDNTPWDIGHVPVRLSDYLNQSRFTGSVLIPGCGAAHEAKLFAGLDWKVTAVDFSPSAVMRARESLGELPGEVVLADFLSYRPVDEASNGFDCVYERAFLCSLPPMLRTRYVQQCASLLKEGGQLVGFFYVADGKKGPPFPISHQELLSTMSAAFDLLADEPVSEDSLAIFKGNERWQVWRRR